MNKIILLSLLVVSMAVATRARTYRVSTTGNDDNPGSEKEPLRTIQKAVDMARAGDVILVHNGIYREAVVLRFSGQDGRPIVIKNYPGERPVIQPGELGKQPPGQGVLLQAQEGYQNPVGWITIEGLEIRYGWDGIKIYNAHDIIIRNCNIHENWNQGILGNGNRVLIDRNIIAGNGTNKDIAQNLIHGIYATGTAFTITNNLIHSNTAYGIQVAAYDYKEESMAGPEYADARNWFVANNTIALNKNRAGMVIWQDGVENCVVQNNIFFRNGGVNGILFYSQQNQRHPVRNNIFFPPGENLVSTEDNAYEGIDNKQIDPHFVNADSFDFHLKADSPAIDASSADCAPKTDFDGKHRPQGDKVDIGAYEFLPIIAVPCWEMYEFELQGLSHVDNPFRDAVLIGEFTSPSGKMLIVEGYYDGGDTWRLRFTPDEEGQWRYLLAGEGVELLVRGSLSCVASESHGFIGIHPDNPYAFAYADGTPFFPMGDTCYGLYSDSPITPALRTQYLKTRRSQRFNFVRLGVIHSPTHWQTDPNYWPWGGTPEKPDLDRFNPQFFQGLDAVLDEMQKLGMNAELIMLNYYMPPFTDERAWTSQRERQWLRYITARYAAFPNLFLWTIANEYETHPDGGYHLDQPDDPDWARATARFIKQHDPYHHLVTVHPVISATTHGRTPNDPFEPPWRIGEFFGKDDSIDVLSQQTGQSGKGVVWNGQLQCWTGDAPDLVGSLRADRRYRRSVLNTENGYEYLRGYPTENKQVHHTDKVRRSAWRIACAGGYFAAGFNGTIGHSDFWNRIDAPNHYTFIVKDEGAAGQLGLLYDFFVSLPFWRMQPFDGVAPDTAVALAEPGRVYVIYLPHGGEVTVDLSAASGIITAQWLDPVKGTITPDEEVRRETERAFKSPLSGDAVLIIRSDQ